jgi:hypothetical protein
MTDTALTPSPRRGTIAFTGVAIAIVVLFVVLPRNHDDAAPIVATTTTTAAPTTTLSPTFRLCLLARQFVADSKDLVPYRTAALAEVFYSRARELVNGPLVAEVDAAARYFEQVNAIGEPAAYDINTILSSPDADRWIQLVTRPPVGVDQASAGIEAICLVQLPPPPTVITTTTTDAPPRTTPETSATPG